MNDINCLGSEMRLIDCQYSQNFNCSHERGAGVACQQPGNLGSFSSRSLMFALI
ncbi:hypothetical protein HOLleu_35526 [Holothuria leucospilota]|uniref:SRCR domain-containing protein n=1 Tax=Holothuria leucospilota TaxID=206669 RepID=A0A9Q0YIK9_HOLLE|nr:hypothetical protein HOLleu_35526 [Holothuria leucospilota]